jgi:hypothetical protein
MEWSVGLLGNLLTTMKEVLAQVTAGGGGGLGGSAPSACPMGIKSTMSSEKEHASTSL